MDSRQAVPTALKRSLAVGMHNTLASSSHQWKKCELSQKLQEAMGSETV